MATVPATLSQIANAQLGANLPLAYGYHDVRGNELINHQITASKNRLSLRVLGEGEWDGIERLFINSKLVNQADTTLVHFHPGVLGTLGHGLTPESTGGDQLVDSFFSLLPANFQPLTLSGKAYIFCNVPPDPAAPTPNLDILGHFRCCKVRIFDNTGAQTAYQFSTNGAWQILDLILRRMIKPDWSPAAAAVAGGDLTAAEKARIDWSSVADAATQCDVLVGSNKRFESNIAFPSQISLRDALAQMELINQIWVTEAGGKIYVRADQARASTFTLTKDHYVAGSLQADQVELHGATNRWIATYRDINPQDAADIDTPANSGLVRAANVVTVKTVAVHPYLVNDDVEIVNPDDASFAGRFVVASVPDTTHFTYAQVGANATSGNGYTGTPESRFAQKSIQIDHQQHQKAIGQRGLSLTAVPRPIPTTIDLGNNTTERVRRILNFVKQRLLGLDASPYAPPWTLKLQAYLDAVDASNRALIAQLMGDIITIDATVSEEFQGNYEIKQAIYSLPDPTQGAAQARATIDLTLKQDVSGAYSDGTILAVAMGSSAPGSGLVPLETVSGGVLDLSTDSLTDGTGSPLTGGKRGFNAIDNLNIVVAAGLDFSRGYTGKNLDNIPDTQSFVRSTYAQAKQAHGVFLETFESPITGASFVWTQVGSETGSGITYPADGQAGGKALAHSAAGKDCWFVFPQNIPFDPSKMYRIRARARKTANVNNTFLFVGVEGVAADGVTLVNVSGLNQHGSQHYVCANAVNTPVSTNWTEYTGYFKGWGAYAPSSDPNTPSGLHTGIHYFHPLFILNETSGAGNGGDSWELDYIAIDIMPDSTDNIADGAGSPLTGGKRGFSAIDSGNIVVAGSVDFSRGYTNKHLGNIPDDAGSDRRAATANQLTGGTRAFSNINADNTYATIPYHGSAFRRITTTAEGGSTTAGAGAIVAYTTLGSFPLQIPSGFSSYKGTLGVQKNTGLASGYTIKGRLKIGSLLSNEITITGPTTAGNGTVTVTGITGGTQITVEVQLFIDNSNDLSHTLPASVSFSHDEYLDQNISNLQ